MGRISQRSLKRVGKEFDLYFKTNDTKNVSKTMEIYKVNGNYYKNKIIAENVFKNDAVDYFKENKLDERSLEDLKCGGKQYVADRYLKRDNAKIVSYLEIIQVII